MLHREEWTHPTGNCIDFISTRCHHRPRVLRRHFWHLSRKIVGADSRTTIRGMPMKRDRYACLQLQNRSINVPNCSANIPFLSRPILDMIFPRKVTYYSKLIKVTRLEPNFESMEDRFPNLSLCGLLCTSELTSVRGKPGHICRA